MRQTIRFIWFLALFLAIPCRSVVAQPSATLCMDGTLLFREDFGGNDVNDPPYSTTPLPEMSPQYHQVTTDAFGALTAGGYFVTKSGICRSDSTDWRNKHERQMWFLQDDHTYPDDYTRGYFLEIDGQNDNEIFYSKTINGLCEGTELSFTAYVANIVTPIQDNWWQSQGYSGYGKPHLLFELKDKDGNILDSYDTGEIPTDASLDQWDDWVKSSQWNLVGTNFIIPTGIDEITLTISNHSTGSSAGNDFALDDIEIRLCMPPVKITSASEACLDSVYTFEVDFTNDGTLSTSLEYKWWFSQDQVTWTERTDLSEDNLTMPAVQKADSGWYQIAVSGAGNINNRNCRSVSEPFLLKTKACDPPEKHGCDSILVNKYDWVLLVNNVRVRELYPDSVVTGYQWFKNGEQIEDAVEDDYSEQDRLVGSFQVLLNFAGGDTICSNIIEILPEPEPPMTMISVYNSTGLLVRQWQTMNEHEQYALPKGIYLLRIERGKEVKTGKLCIP